MATLPTGITITQVPSWSENPPSTWASEESVSFTRGPQPALPSLDAGRPSRLQLGSLRDARLRLVRPLELAVREEDGSVVVASESLSEFGYGSHLTEAIEDFAASLSALYWSLRAEQARLGPDLFETWSRLRAIIQEHAPQRA